MNTKTTIIMTSALALGAIGIASSIQQPETVQAETIYNLPSDFTFESGGQALEIYSDPGLTQKTGRKLDPSITSWRAFNTTVTSDSVGLPQYDLTKSGIFSYDLGGGQWVQGTMMTSDIDKWDVAEVFTQGGNIPVYSDSALTHQIGTLDNGVHDWKVNRLLMMSSGFLAADIGYNQWVKIDNTDGTGPHIMRQVAYVDKDTTLYNGKGVPTGKVPEFNYYRFFEFKILDNGHYYGRIGSDNQWVDMRNTGVDI
ncbi:hypothetical protein [Holzapfeliella sp. JNUCC 72]